MAKGEQIRTKSDLGTNRRRKSFFLYCWVVGGPEIANAGYACWAENPKVNFPSFRYPSRCFCSTAKRNSCYPCVCVFFFVDKCLVFTADTGMKDGMDGR